MEPFLYRCGLCYEHNGREYFFVCCQFRKRVGQSYGRGIYRQIARNQQDRNKRYKSGIFKRSQLCRDARAESKSQYGNNGRGRNQSVFRRFREYVAFGFPKPKSGRISQPVDKRYGFRRRFQQLFAIAVAQPVAYGFNFRIGYEFHNKRCIRKSKLYARVFLYQRCKQFLFDDCYGRHKSLCEQRYEFKRIKRFKLVERYDVRDEHNKRNKRFVRLVQQFFRGDDLGDQRRYFCY